MQWLKKQCFTFKVALNSPQLSRKMYDTFKGDTKLVPIIKEMYVCDIQSDNKLAPIIQGMYVYDIQSDTKLAPIIAKMYYVCDI